MINNNINNQEAQQQIRVAYKDITTSSPQEDMGIQPIPEGIMIDGLPLDLMRYFSIDFRDITEQSRKHLEDIISWFPPKTSMGDKMIKISSIESRLGTKFKEDRLMNVWNYMRLNNKIFELEKQRASLEK